jgi:L-amino acid N-acyltransferase YncA
MTIKIRQYGEEDLPQMVAIWNEVVDEGIAFPQEDDLTLAQRQEVLCGAESRCSGRRRD